ncbi:SH3 domain-containing protein [Agrobacterium sp.]|uniref:SH3 domain-containing protein n=1 Tax=Agrobacterium sp. TaxID=361 RepID=UPI0028A72D02|nr:SH3 domain-containing protein [Agrobacterium sp.]
MKKKLYGAIALLALVSMPALAEAATRGFATANVNMRSGPSTAYPAVVVIPEGAPLVIHGCLSDTPWCDVSFSRGRGWVAGRYVQAEYRQNRVYVEPRYYRDLGVPIITFDVGRYWDRYYRDRDFYRDRDRWNRPHPPRSDWGGPPPSWNRPPPPRGPNDGRWEQRYGQEWDSGQRPPRRDDRRDDEQRSDNRRDDSRRDRQRWSEDSRPGGNNGDQPRRQYDPDRQRGGSNDRGEPCMPGMPGCRPSI